MSDRVRLALLLAILGIAVGARTTGVLSGTEHDFLAMPAVVPGERIDFGAATLPALLALAACCVAFAAFFLSPLSRPDRPVHGAGLQAFGLIGTALTAGAALWSLGGYLESPLIDLGGAPTRALFALLGAPPLFRLHLLFQAARCRPGEPLPTRRHAPGRVAWERLALLRPPGSHRVSPPRSDRQPAYAHLLVALVLGAWIALLLAIAFDLHAGLAAAGVDVQSPEVAAMLRRPWASAVVLLPFAAWFARPSARVALAGRSELPADAAAALAPFAVIGPQIPSMAAFASSPLARPPLDLVTGLLPIALLLAGAFAVAAWCIGRTNVRRGPLRQPYRRRRDRSPAGR